MRGNFWLKVQNSPKLDFIVMQMNRVNREYGYYILTEITTISG